MVEPTGIALRSDVNGTTPDAGASAARDSRGRFITSTSAGGTLALWTPAGVFDRMLARPGRGPGELVGYVNVFVAAGDTIYARDNTARISVFAPDGSFVRRFPARYAGGMTGSTLFGSNGEIVSAAASAAADSRACFHVSDHEGNHIRSFGQLDTEDSVAFAERLLTLVSDHSPRGTLWVAVRRGSPRGYELQEWSIAGTRLRSIHRNASWFPIHEWPAPLRERPGGTVFGVHVDSLGRLLVHATVPNARVVATARR